MTYKEPKRGYVINDSDYGTIFIGEDNDSKRPRQLELHASSNACLKLFKDGGFEIQSQESSKSADNILSRSKEGLCIKTTGDGIKIDAGNGEITFSARSIRFESSGNDQNLVIRSNGNLQLEANDTIKLDGAVVAIGARNKIFMRSPGPIYVNSSAGVSIVEPKLSLVPTNLLQVVQTLATNVFGY
jgi:uncharacterized protein (DUF2345 family)